MLHQRETSSGGREVRPTANPANVPGPLATHSAGGSASAKILLTDAEGAAALGLSPRLFAQLMHEPWFPRPVVLGPRLKRHVRAELEAAVASMPRQAEPRAEPAQLLRARIERMKSPGVPA